MTDLTLYRNGSITDTTGTEDTRFAYDAGSGLLKTETYGYGNSYSYAVNYDYNTSGQLTSMTKPGVSVGSFSYDNAGRPIGSTTTDTSSNTHFIDSTTYDDQGRPQSIAEKITDSGNNFISSTDNEFTYDPTSGQIASESQVAGTSANYNYYGPADVGLGAEPGAIKNLTVSQNGATLSNTTYTYDSAGRVATETIDGTTTFTYTYKPGTNLISGETVSTAGVGDTLSTGYSYETNTDRLSNITTTAGSTSIYSAGYTYNDNDQRQTESISQLETSNTSTDSHAWTFGYDSRDELTGVTNTSDSSSVASYSYSGTGARTDLGTVNALNQYADFTYNSNGDVTDDGTYAYTWDAKDRLTSITPDSPTSGAEKDAFAYDGQDRRIEKDIYNYNSGTSSWVLSKSLKFAYDGGGNLTAEIDAATNDLLQSYTWDQNGLLLSITDYSTTTPKTYAAIDEPTGTTDELIDTATGEVAATWRYDTWGNVLSSTGDTALNPFGEDGGMQDTGGNSQQGIRELKSPYGQFLSEDKTGQANSKNPYEPVDDDPINKIDPTGDAAEPSSATPQANSTIVCHNPSPPTQAFNLTDYLPSAAEQKVLDQLASIQAEERAGIIRALNRANGPQIGGTSPELQDFLDWADKRYGRDFTEKLVNYQRGIDVVSLNKDSNFQVALEKYLKDQRVSFWDQAGYGIAMRLGDQAFRDAGDGLPTLFDVLAVAAAAAGDPASKIPQAPEALAMSRPKQRATFGQTTSTDYRATFFGAYPQLEGAVRVHHAVEQQVLTKYPGVVSESEMHSLENLRGIPNAVNSDVHLSQIRIEWNNFYEQFRSNNTVPTKEQLLQKATEIDRKYGSGFAPPVKRTR